MGKKDEAPAETAPTAAVKIDAKTIGTVGVTAAAVALLAMASRKITGLSPKNAKVIGGLAGAGLGYVGVQRQAAGKKFLPFG